MPPVSKPKANSVKIAVVTDEVEMLTIVARTAAHHTMEDGLGTRAPRSSRLRRPLHADRSISCPSSSCRASSSAAYLIRTIRP